MPMGAEVEKLAIRTQAAEWLVRFGDQEVSWVDHLRYLEWLRTSPLHEEEMRQVLKLWCALSDPNIWPKEGHTSELLGGLVPCRRRTCREPCRGHEWRVRRRQQPT
jgi:ferric-dicitrate binding protein FerR (iron transport regulator)